MTQQKETPTAESTPEQSSTTFPTAGFALFAALTRANSKLLIDPSSFTSRNQNQNLPRSLLQSSLNPENPDGECTYQSQKNDPKSRIQKPNEVQANRVNLRSNHVELSSVPEFSASRAAVSRERIMPPAIFRAKTLRSGGNPISIMLTLWSAMHMIE